MTPPLPVQAIVAVIGSGAMGAGIAQVAAAAGHTVKLFDTVPKRRPKPSPTSRPVFELADKGKISLEAATAAAGRLVAHNNSPIWPMPTW